MNFKNVELKLSVVACIDNRQNIWLKAKNIASALGYKNTKDAIKTHVDDEYKNTFDNLRGRISRPPENVQSQTIFVNEPGMYSLVFASKLPSAKLFQEWVFSEVLPSIRKTGSYQAFHSANKLVFKIENEFDLHTRVVKYIRRFYPNALVVAGLGELQDTSRKRITSYMKGYQKGQPDIIINNCHKKYRGLCVELKTPQGTGRLSESQEKLLERYKKNGFKCLVSNDYDLVIREVNDYFEGVRVPCTMCKRMFKTSETLKSHLKVFHRQLS